MMYLCFIFDLILWSTNVVAHPYIPAKTKTVYILPKVEITEEDFQKQILHMACQSLAEGIDRTIVGQIMSEEYEKCLHDLDCSIIQCVYPGDETSHQVYQAEFNAMFCRYWEMDKELKELRWMNDPENDGTPFAHPAYCRGEDHGIAMAVYLINKVLDGEDLEEYKYAEGSPWHEMLNRIRRLKRDSS